MIQKDGPVTDTDQYKVGTVIRRAFKTLADHPRKFLLPALIVYVPVGLLMAIDTERGELTALSGIAFIASFLASIGFYAYFSVVASQLSSGNDVDDARAFEKTIKKIGQIIVVSIVSGIAIAFGAVLLIAPGLWLATIWFVFIPVLMLEDARFFDSLTRSRDLVQGSGWSVLLTLLFVAVVGIAIYVILISAAAAISDSSLMLFWIISTVGDGATTILAAIIFYFAYEQLVLLKDGPQSGKEQLNLEIDAHPETGTPPSIDVPPPIDIPPPTDAPPPTDIPPTDDPPRA